MSALEAHPIAQQEVSDEEQPDSPAQAPAEADQLPADATDAQASPDVLYDAPRESAVPETVPTSVTAPVTAALPPKDPHSKLSPAEVLLLEFLTEKSLLCCQGGLPTRSLEVADQMECCNQPPAQARQSTCSRRETSMLFGSSWSSLTGNPSEAQLDESLNSSQADRGAVSSAHALTIRFLCQSRVGYPTSGSLLAQNSTYQRTSGAIILTGTRKTASRITGSVFHDLPYSQ